MSYLQEDSQTPGTGVECDLGLTTTLPKLRGRSEEVLVLGDRAAGRPTQEDPPQLGVNLGRGDSGEELGNQRGVWHLHLCVAPSREDQEGLYNRERGEELSGARRIPR